MAAKRLFNGLLFFFLPTPAQSPINKRKAEAIVKHGGKVAAAIDNSVTHVVVAADAPAREVAKTRKNMALSTYMVSNRWPSDCILRNKLLSVDNYPVQVSSATGTDQIKSPSPPPPSEKLTKLTSSGHKRENENPPRSPARRLKKVYHAHREDAVSSPCSSGLSGSDSNDYDAERSPPLKRRKTGITPEAIKRMFKKEPEPSNSHVNDDIINIFTLYRDDRKYSGHEFEARAYDLALKSLKSVRNPIRTKADALKLPHFGSGMAQKLEDFYKSGIPQKSVQEMRERSDVLALFQTIYAVGPTLAHKFYREGKRTLEDVASDVKDKRMLISIEHHSEFIERISRTEVLQHFQRVSDVIHELDSRALCWCMGSFRRGQADCGDIDIILTREHASKQQLHDLMNKGISRMVDNDFAKFTFGGGPDEPDSSRWLGATALPHNGKWRRMDILCVPWEERGGALIYYTGNDIFNRKIRYLAGRKNMQLNQSGLFEKMPNGGLKLIEGESERRIFEILGVPWLEPQERIF